MIRVAFILRAPEIGGVERQLVELVRGLDPRQFHVGVFPFYPGGALRADLEATPGVIVRDVAKRGRWDLAGFFVRLRRAIDEFQPDVIYGCLGVANETSLLIGRLRHTKVIWSLGAAFVDFSLYDWTARPLFALGKQLSRFPDAIVINSHAGRDYFAQCGYDVSRMEVIPNGFDTARFTRREADGAATRRAWGLMPDDVVIGMAARVDPIKNHRLFMDVATRLTPRHPRLRFVCIGGGAPDFVQQLRTSAAAIGLGDRLLWAGSHDNMPAAYNALDLHCLCSLGEGLPNTVGESMACEVPNVVTDVGDAARVVGDTGTVVPSNTLDALEQALESLLALPAAARRDLGTRARQRIVQQYDAPLLAQRTSDLLRRVTGRPAGDSA